MKNIKLSKYKAIPFKVIETNHLVFCAEVNSIKGDFILDTGASASCIGTDFKEKFQLIVKESDLKATGAGKGEIQTLKSEENKLKLGKWKMKKMPFILIDLSHINTALQEHQVKRIHGIIGADVLQKGKAIVDYGSKKLYLKK